MATDSLTSSGLIGSLNSPGTSGSAAKAKKDDPNSIGQNEFLHLLITQLKNQDPLDPMKNDQFAVDMAQFSQVEQLIQINDKLGAQSTGDASSLAAYLGREVVLSDKNISVSDSEGGDLRIDLIGDASSVKIDILGSDGRVLESLDAGAMSKGKNRVSLTNLGIPDGEYGYKVAAFDANGGEISNKSSVAGVVSGFIPGADPKLVIGAREVSPSAVTEVGAAR